MSGTRPSRGLERRLVGYFAMIVLATLMIGVEFAVALRPAAVTGPQAALGPDPSAHDDTPPLIRVRTRILGMLATLTVVIAIVLLMFVHNIGAPLQAMVGAAQRINAGDLTQVVSVETGDEIGQLGQALNELTSNLQELAALSHDSATRIRAATGALRARLAARRPGEALPLDELERHIAGIEGIAEGLLETLASFDLLSSAPRASRC